MQMMAIMALHSNGCEGTQQQQQQPLTQPVVAKSLIFSDESRRVVTADRQISSPCYWFLLQIPV